MVTSQVRYQHAMRTANGAESGCRGDRYPGNPLPLFVNSLTEKGIRIVGRIT
jgi:hypothetical protein